ADQETVKGVLEEGPPVRRWHASEPGGVGFVVREEQPAASRGVKNPSAQRVGSVQPRERVLPRLRLVLSHQGEDCSPGGAGVNGWLRQSILPPGPGVAEPQVWQDV